MKVGNDLSNTIEALGTLADSVQALMRENGRLNAELSAVSQAMEEKAKEHASALAEADYWRTRYSTREDYFKPSPKKAAAKRRQRSA